MSRHDGRQNNEMRKIHVVKDYIMHPDGSCVIEFGKTRVVCTASVEEKVPGWMKNSGEGWVTAEYGMLPGSTNTRIRRDRAAGSGRTQEIQRLIGRSLRGVIDFRKLGERTIKIDCDVIQADGGTRTAAITGGFIALVLACQNLMKKNIISSLPITDYIAAISVGIYKKELLLDLNYIEDSDADMDMNVVKIGSGQYIEVQGTAEGQPYSKQEMDDLLDLASKGIEDLIDIQKKCIGDIRLG